MLTNADRVRENTADNVNVRIDNTSEANVRQYAAQDQAQITSRIIDLDKEWDIERWLELNASALAGLGLLIAYLLNNAWWLLIPAVVLPFLFMHAMQGWCPPVPIMRRLGVRTRKEIDAEKHALKALRGDYEGSSRDPETAWRAATL